MDTATKQRRFASRQVGRRAVCALVLPALFALGSAECCAQAGAARAQANSQAATRQFAALLTQANALVGQEKFAEASDVGRKALAFFKQMVPDVTHNTLVTVAWLADIEEHAEHWPEAEKLRREIVEGLTKLNGADHWQTADARRALLHTKQLRLMSHDEVQELFRAARLMQRFERESPAESLKKAEQALEIRRRLVGTENTLYAASANDVGLQLFLSGDLVRAEPRYLEAREIYRRVVGTEHPAYAQLSHNLAGLYESMGDVARAAPLYAEALAIKKRTFGPYRDEYAQSLLALAALWYSSGEEARAEAAALEARGIFERTQSKFSPQYGRAQYFLGMLYAARGEIQKAEPLLIEARNIYKTTFGEKDFQYAQCLGGLASLHYAAGNYAEAETLYSQALDICKAAVGEKHPGYAATLNQLAFVFAADGKPEQAEPRYREAIGISRGLMEATSVLQSERQQLAMGQALRHQLDNYVSLGVNTGRYAREIFANVLNWKGATLVRQRGMRLAADDPAVAESFKKLQEVVGRAASLSRAVPDASQQAAWQAQLTQLGAERERLEAELSAKSAAFRQATKPTTLEELLAALPNDAVLVDYLEYRRALPTRIEPSGLISPVQYQRQYVAFVVRHAAKPAEQVTMIPLGDAAPIGTAVDVWRKTYGMDSEAVYAGALLRTSVWEPLRKAIAGAKTILVSTDGALGRMPLAALPGRDAGKYLLEEERLAMLPVPQLLPTLVSDAGKRAAEHELLLLGDVDYDSSSSGAAADATGQSAKKKQPRRPGENQAANASRTPADDKLFDPLTNTAGEIAAIGSLYAGLYDVKPNDPLSLVRAQAGEAKFRELAPHYRHLHLATHGFFAAPEYASALDSLAPGNDRGRALLVGRDSPVAGTSPGLLSGLALAGANREPTAAADDGILTSQEISTLDLSGVDTVVLSACDTGLGATAGGEGLLGVQRAFQTAGARTTVASYWKVDDLVTRLLMERFYRNLWDKEMTRLDALREAQLYVLNHPEVLRGGDAPQETKERTSPRLWGAFSLSGDWR